MSSRLTKKSLVSFPACLVKTPCLESAGIGAEHAQAADQNRHLRSRQPQQRARSTNASSGCHELQLLAVDVVAEAVGTRLERRKRLDVGLLLRRVRAARRERDLHVDAGILGGLLDRGGAAENDQVGQRDLLAGLLLDCFELRKHRLELGRLVDLPVLLRARRMRAPLAPPRLSEPRNVDADAQAVETSCDTVRPDARIFAFSAVASASLSAHGRQPGSGPARSASPSAPAGRGSARSGPCRGA